MKKIDVYRHKRHTVYKFSKRIIFFKQHDKMMFFFKGKLVKNHRFIIRRPNKKWRELRWFIRQPYFYFERNNGGIYLGTPNKYFHFPKSYI